MTVNPLNVLITGANTGIGFETARALAKGGNHVTLACRNETAAKIAVETIKKEIQNEEVVVTFIQIDLSDLQSVKKCANDIINSKYVFDIIILNAGTMLPENIVTRDGFETTFQVNYLAQYLLLNMILDSDYMNTKQVKVVCLTSILYKLCGNFFTLPTTFLKWRKFSHNSLVSETETSIKSTKYRKWNYYAASKAAAAMLAYNLNQRDNISAVSVHPGCVRTAMTYNISPKTEKGLKIFKRYLISAEEAANNVVLAIEDLDRSKNHSKMYRSEKKSKKLDRKIRKKENWEALKEYSDRMLASP
uniref:SDR family NAD(P)-dependent oxidoreductase n=1 Tax=Rhabditophanes sp. KR3021 TaxID=114890 RepID=A0AC35U5W4_9BILA